jgi:uncharacterized coiled-coil protein SlyX
MSSLKEKDIEDHPYVKWLEKKVEDAEKEIEFQKARVDVANEMVTSKQKRIDELKQKLQQTSMKSHWRKPDHVTFLLMLPFILAVLVLCLFGDLFWIEVSGCVLLLLWFYALSYDLEEEKEAKP